MNPALLIAVALGLCIFVSMYAYRIAREFFRHVVTPRYEHKDMLQEYIQSQYGVFLAGKKYQESEDFYQRILAESVPYLNPTTTALDAGCALGRIAFEYERAGIQKCVALDGSGRFIRFCKKIQAGTSGIPFPFLRKSRVQFLRADIFRYIPEVPFSFVSCVNVFDRVVSPEKLVGKLASLLEKSGTLLITTPYDWNASPAPLGLRVSDMKELFGVGQWTLQKEVRDLPYIVPVEGRDMAYSCHLLIFRKI